MLTNSDQIKQYWNDFSSFYGSNLEYIYVQCGLSLSRMLKLDQAESILEVGCGSGELTLHWLMNLPPKTRYLSIDLSDDMIQLAEQKKAQKKYKLNDITHHFKVANAEMLDFIEDESIDVYLGSLVIHLANDPKQMLREAKRVLKPKGRIGFNVLGKNDVSPFFNIAHSALKKLELIFLQKAVECL